MQRAKMRESLRDHFDVVIIGGGITGAGAARDAAMRGLKVALIEMKDLAYGTSSRSSKLVHGGLRYLEQAEFSMVFESVSERKTLMDIAPHLVNPCGFLFPVYKSSRRGVFAVNLGMWLYDGLSLFRSPKIHRNLSRKEVAEIEPMLNQQDLRGAPLYYDCATDDARLTLETALDAAQHGAVIATYTKVTGFFRNPKGRIIGVWVRDELSGEEWEVKASTVINATGPWSDRTRALGSSTEKPRLRPTKGIHVVVLSERLSLSNAVVCFHPKDGRVLFAIPWGDRSYIGTTDTDYQGDPGDICASKEDIVYLLEAMNHYFPNAALVQDDIISTWAGLRPLIADESSGDESAVSREHELRVDADGLITIAGGKLTTYRKMAVEIIDKAVDMLKLTDQLPRNRKLRAAPTDDEPLPGAVGWPADDDHDAIAKKVLEQSAGVLSIESALMLCGTYGMRAFDLAEQVAKNPEQGELLQEGRPEIILQVDYAIDKEQAYRLCDFMIRRTQIFFRDEQQGLGFCEKVAERMADILGWDADRTAAEIMLYQEEVARSRRWQEE